jgi:hypothetical protein
MFTVYITCKNRPSLIGWFIFIYFQQFFMSMKEFIEIYRMWKNKEINKGVVVMKKWLLLVFVLVLSIFPASCFAQDKDRGLEDYAYARAMAIGYALDIKELYQQGEISQWQYLEAKEKYQLVAAKFMALKSLMEFSIINESALNGKVITNFKNIGNEAYDQYTDFSSTAHHIITNGNKSFFTETGIVSLVELFITQNQTRKESKVTNLKAWLEKYYEWPTWDKIGNAASKTVTTDVTKTTNGDSNSQNNVVQTEKSTTNVNCSF